MKKVQILLSTYNGEKYLAEQLDSLLAQDYPEVSILIRDDGSVDRTLTIIQSYCNNNANIHYYQGKNIGCWKSFMDLVEKSDISVDYLAFCDQDDLWKVGKIRRAVEQLNNMDAMLPLLYCSKLTPVGENLQNIRVTIHNINFRPSFGNAIIQNICTGCTGVINRTAAQMTVGKQPNFMVQHDWWFYLICSCYGNVFYDENSFILYRQHGNNEVGARTTRWEQFLYRLRTFTKKRGNIYKQLYEFKRLYQLSKRNEDLTELVLGTKQSLKRRFQMILDHDIYRQNLLDDFIFKVIILLGIA